MYFSNSKLSSSLVDPSYTGILGDSNIIREVEAAQDVNELRSSHPVEGHHYYPKFESLNVEIAAALKKIMENSNFTKEVRL